jgi:DNA mismatch endonuclease, patch repair protein
VHAMGFRYRLHLHSLPGTPDLVFCARKKIVFVHGCFWHMHSCQRGKLKPVTNSAFWSTKRLGNARRDRATNLKLRRAGWKVLTIWECWTKDEEKVRRRIVAFLRK